MVASFILPSVSSASIDTNLKYGSRGGYVTELQEFLIDKGFLTGQSSGNFFSLTRKAVIAWQASIGLPATGFVGPMSRTKINDELSQANAPAVLAEISETGTTTVSINKPALVPGCSSVVGFSITTGSPCSSATTPVPVIPVVNKIVTLQNGAVVEIDASGNIISFISSAVPEVVPTQAQSVVASSMQMPTKISQAHIEIHPIQRNGLNKEYIANPDTTDNNNFNGHFIVLGAVVYDANGNVDRDAVMTITTSDATQNKVKNGTGDVITIYPNDEKLQVLGYKFNYDFKTPGDHTITFSANGLSKDVTINAK